MQTEKVNWISSVMISVWTCMMRHTNYNLEENLQSAMFHSAQLFSTE